MENFDLGALAVAITVITGVVNGIALATAKLPNIETFKGFINFVIAVVLGLVFGALHFFGLSGVEAGIVAALAASGLYKFTQNIGGK